MDFENMQEEVKTYVRQIFDNIPSCFWCSVAILMLTATKGVCNEYYGKGIEELANKWKELMEKIKSDLGYDEEG